MAKRRGKPVSSDLFYAECRAYGRVREARDERRIETNIATRCYGSLFLSTEDMDLLQ
ncbi:hypothetical protein F4860DRAFT_497992 [Xylaria cubensis]|nr:hypothetical protein F4860DRAFT_497992 [Xylaria cubensis]